jgi:hypothetical protein
MTSAILGPGHNAIPSQRLTYTIFTAFAADSATRCFITPNIARPILPRFQVPKASAYQR